MGNRAPPAGTRPTTNCPLPTPEDRLLCILVYLKTYPLQVVQGRLFGMGQSKAHQWIHVLLVVLQATLRALGDAPTRSVQELAKRLGVAEADTPRTGHADAWTADLSRSTCTGTCLPPVGHDGTERRIGRPQDPTEQTRYYSGKKKCHTVKNVLLINATLTILFLSGTYAGSTHDKRIAEATPYPLPAGSRLLQDLGFLAFTLDQVELIMPTKKPRGRALTRAQKPRIAASRAAACASSTSTVASSAVALSTTPAAFGRRASAIWSWKSAVRCITSGCVSRHGNRWFNRDELYCRDDAIANWFRNDPDGQCLNDRIGLKF